MSSAPSPAEALNQGCYCRTLNPEHLRRELTQGPDPHGLVQDLAQRRPHLFSSTAVFLSQAVAQQLAAAVQAIERVIALPGYVAQALERAPPIAVQAPGARGVCMGYDFHIAEQGPQLIEINTNAGGLLLNAALLRAQVACCDAMQQAYTAPMTGDALEHALRDMFLAEWRLQRSSTAPGLVAIVDDDPAVQYLAPEFALFQQLLERHGMAAVVLDPAALSWRDGRLWHGRQVVDMVYNRLTDFYLEAPACLALRQAYEAGAVVLTPHPHAHALYADKRNLVALSDDAQLARWGVPMGDRLVLQTSVPRTELVCADHAESLWARRKQLFFKPVAGYGSKAAYRGDKLTKRVWSEILLGGFVAQALVPPAHRQIKVDGALSDLKFDVRAYTYAGEIQLLAARMYSGQTTNFRTEGGGFAPVMVLP